MGLLDTPHEKTALTYWAERNGINFNVIEGERL